MIYAWHNGLRYGIQFSYTKGKRGHRQDTECCIYVLGNNLDDKPELGDDNLMGAGDALLFYEDNFCAETGRKISLARALDNAGDFEPLLNCKEFRTTIWAAYRARNTSLEEKQKDEAGRIFGAGC